MCLPHTIQPNESKCLISTQPEIDRRCKVCTRNIQHTPPSSHPQHSPLRPQNKRLQFLEIRHPQPGRRIPPLGRIPCSARHDPRTRNRLSRLAVDTVTTDCRAARDIGQTLVEGAVDERVQEAERGLAGAQTRVVKEADDGGPDGCGGGSAAGEGEAAVDDDGVAVGVMLVDC